MGTRKEYEAIDWKRLLREFEVFGPDDEFTGPVFMLHSEKRGLLITQLL
jgi:hypothetical protein